MGRFKTDLFERISRKTNEVANDIRWVIRSLEENRDVDGAIYELKKILEELD